MALSEMQFPGESWIRYRRDFKDDSEAIDSARFLSATGITGSDKNTVFTEGGQAVGASGSWHDREEMRTRRYFHGSGHAIPVGSYVVPGADLGKNNFPHFGEPRNRAVFMAFSPDRARYMAESAQGDPDSFAPGERPDVYVHEVEPEGIRDVHERVGAEYQAQRAKVVRRWRYRDTGAGHEDFDAPSHEQLKLDI